MALWGFKIICKCLCCDGYGFVSDRHPNDPSSKNVACHECEGEGQKIFFGAYDSIADARDDYPEAISFTYI